jgi:hypothetical protein
VFSQRNAGAYGFGLVARTPVELPDLVEQAADATSVAVDWSHGAALFDAFERGDDRFVMAHRGAGLLDVVREPATIVCCLAQPITPAVFVHPIMTLPLSFLARWRGDATLHGGAFLHDDRAWVVTGEREAGKSALLARLAQRGVPIVADDLVVIEGYDVLAGPSCVDLRPDTAERIPEAEKVGVVGSRTRYRLRTPPAPARVPLGGICLLEWADSPPQLDLLRVEDSLRVLHRQHYAAELAPPEPRQTLTLLERPVWRFRRRRDWARADSTLDHLLEALRRS